MDSTYIFYLNDSIKELIRLAQETKKGDLFNDGILFGYYSSISLLLNQAESFNISNQLDGEIKNFNPETLLIKD
ncbi:hypothetical protein [uncultured Flavobacterium sp.]|uniref:hypothetical protein n=1 Tax=uncultured Flavobacterium sp. TaxID=165435 RepID=UPI00292F9D5E|nr:hypothetical protein [uncultured Flavobacterium sp.]